MTNNMIANKVQSVLDIFARIDAERGDRGPGRRSDSTIPRARTIDDEVAGVELDADEGDTGDIRALQRRGRQ